MRLCIYLILVVLVVRVRGRGWQLVLARLDDACVDQYSLSSKLHRPRAPLIKWLLWWQNKSLELEIFCGDSRLRLTKIIYTVAALRIYYIQTYLMPIVEYGDRALGWCLKIGAT